MKKIAKIINVHSKKIDLLTELLPEVAWVSPYLQNKILAQSNILGVVIDKYRHREVPVHELAELLNMTQLLDHSEDQKFFTHTVHT